MKHLESKYTTEVNDGEDIDNDFTFSYDEQHRQILVEDRSRWRFVDNQINYYTKCIEDLKEFKQSKQL